MDGCVNILANKPFIEKNRVFIVIAFPGHKAYKSVFAETYFAVIRCGTVRDNIAFVYVLAYLNNRSLVNAGALVGAHKFCNRVVLHFTGVAHNINTVGVNFCNRAGFLRKQTHARVNSGFIFHTGADHGSLSLHKRNSLPLHI